MVIWKDTLSLTGSLSVARQVITVTCASLIWTSIGSVAFSLPCWSVRVLTVRLRLRTLQLVFARTRCAPMIGRFAVQPRLHHVAVAARQCSLTSTYRTKLFGRPALRPRPAVPFAVRSSSSTTTATSSNDVLWRKLWVAYCTALERRPLLTKASMASVIFFTSDSVTQYLLKDDTASHEEANSSTSASPDQIFEWDAARAVSAGCFGVVSTTFLHFWWGFLERTVAARIPVTTHRLANTAVKVLWHQSMAAPFYIYCYYVVTNFGHRLAVQPVQTFDGVGQAWKEVNEKAAHMLWPTMMRHWSVWPWVQSFNFYFTPLHHRVLVHNTVLMFWSGYLSYLNHNKHQGSAPFSDEMEDATETVVDATVVSACRPQVLTTIHHAVSEESTFVNTTESTSLKSR
jgi:protein Mpv17